MGFGFVLSFIVAIGLIVVWSSSIRNNAKAFKRIHYLFIAALTLIGPIYVLDTSGVTNFYEHIPGVSYQSSFLGQFFLVPVALLLLVAFSLYFKTDKSVNESDINRKVVSTRRNLKIWYLLSVIVFVVGIGAWIIDFNNPSDLDFLTGTNDSAYIILIITFVILAILGIGTRFSYLKYSRINQAELIANAIGSQLQSSNASDTQDPGGLQVQNHEERLRKLESLLSNGLVSQNEFAQKKKEIIDSL